MSPKGLNKTWVYREQADGVDRLETSLPRAVPVDTWQVIAAPNVTSRRFASSNQN